MDWISIYIFLRAILRFIGCVVNIFTAIPVYVTYSTLLRPLQYWRQDLYQAIEGRMYNMLQEHVGYWCWSAGYTVLEVGADLSDLLTEECILLGNHQTTADVPILMSIVSNRNKSTLGRNVYWIMDHIFRFFPFGWVSVVHGDFFIRQGRDTRSSQLDVLRQHLRDIYVKMNRTWILLFPEGGFLYKRLRSSQQYALKNNYPVLENVTLPRLGAVQMILDELTPWQPTVCNGVCGDAQTLTAADDKSKKTTKHIKWIIDMTIAYPPNDPLDLLQIWLGIRDPCQTVVHYRRFRASEVPLADEGKLLKWLYDRWAEKDRLLETYYRTGLFPRVSADEPAPRPLIVNSQRSVVTAAYCVVAMWINLKLLYAGVTLVVGCVSAVLAAVSTVF